MKLTKTCILFLLAILMCLPSSCGGHDVKMAQGNGDTIDVAFVAERSPSLVGTVVSVKGVCDHFGIYEGRRMYMLNPTDSTFYRFDATASMGGTFPQEAIGRNILITGLVQEHRIDRVYIEHLKQSYSSKREQLSMVYDDSSPYLLVESAPVGLYVRGSNPDSVFAETIEYYEKSLSEAYSRGLNYIPYYYIDVISYELR